MLIEILTNRFQLQLSAQIKNNCFAVCIVFKELACLDNHYGQFKRILVGAGLSKHGPKFCSDSFLEFKEFRFKLDRI